MDTLNWLSWTIGSFIFVLGIMIFIHELGHYLMAKYLGIRVEVFSLGFGPRLFGFRKGDTDYRVSVLPLGGYVKMTGETFDDDLTGDPGEFLSRPKMQRFAVAVAGPLMNLGLAVGLLALVYMIGIQVPAVLDQPPVIGYIPADSPARAAGLQIGDEIVTFNGQATPNWQELTFAYLLNPAKTVPIEFRREGRLLETQIRVEELAETGEGSIGVYPPSSNRVQEVVPGPAAEAGLLDGDEILSVEVDGQRAEYQSEIRELIAEHEGVPLMFRVRRGDEVLQMEITPRMAEEGRVLIGILFEIGKTRTEHYGPLQAFSKSLETNYRFTRITFDIVRKLLTGETSIKMVSGPIEIARFSGEAAAQGSSQLVGFMALISLQLGLFNLFPIPILDGGVIFLLLIEALMGRDLSIQAKERILQAGFVFLVLLMGIVLFNDIAKNI